MTQRTVTVGVIDDTSDEADEVFYLELSNASGAAIGDSRGAATIVDDDVNLPSSVTGSTVTLGVGRSVSAATAFSVFDPEGDAIVTYGFKDWGVGETTAYVSMNGVRQPDASWVEVSAADFAQTTIVGGSEPGFDAIYVWAHDGTGWGSAGKVSVTTVATPEFAINDVRVDETAGSATFTVTRGGDSSAAASVDYATADGSATHSDYLSASGTLTFGAGVTQRTVTVGVIDDTSDEADEVFYLELSNASGAAIGDSRGAATIVDDDVNLPSSVTGSTVTLGVGRSVSAATAFSVFDPEGDAMVTYGFKDWGVGETTAYVSVNGVRQPDASWVEVSAADFAQTTIVGGSEPGLDAIYVWAHDGTGWGSAGKVSVTTVAGIPALPPDAPSGSQFAVFDSTIGEGDLDHYTHLTIRQRQWRWWRQRRLYPYLRYRRNSLRYKPAVQCPAPRRPGAFRSRPDRIQFSGMGAGRLRRRGR